MFRGSCWKCDAAPVKPAVGAVGENFVVGLGGCCCIFNHTSFPNTSSAMPVETTATSPTSPTSPSRRGFVLMVICLFATLSLLFHKDFQPDQVLFANDGPLGAVRAQSDYAL